MRKQNAEKKLQRLREILSEMKSALIAFSGGIDSTFLLSVAREVLGKRVIAVTAVSPTYPPEELAQAKRIMRLLGMKLSLLNTSETKNEKFLRNTPNRCYFCKLELFTKLRARAKRLGIDNVLDGSNIDDLRDHRPGRKAAQELGVRSPLQEVGLTKEEIRFLAKRRGLPNWAKEPVACLASRFPYGMEISCSDLKRVDAAETFLRQLGFKNVRARHYGDLVRIEVCKSQIGRLASSKTREKIVKRLKSLGYSYVTVDLQGYRTGSLNEVL